MKHIKYLNVVLTIIAACLVLITGAVTGLLPTASAKGGPRNDGAFRNEARNDGSLRDGALKEGPRYVAVPLNADGSINVRLTGNTAMDVNISRVGGDEILHRELPVNINLIRGQDVRYSPLPVTLTK